MKSETFSAEGTPLRFGDIALLLIQRELTVNEEDQRKALLKATTKRLNAYHKKLYHRNPSNTVYAKTNDHFKAACEAAELKPTSRQASKFRNKKGKAYEHRAGAA